ncbi:MAG: hypothetical protein ACREHD_00305, partial [Pirellulales bacterium]
MWLRVTTIALRLLVMAGVIIASLSTARAQPAAGEIELAPAASDDPITISADQSNQWHEGQYDVLLLRGHCVVGQGYNTCRGNDAVVWIKKGDG